MSSWIWDKLGISKTEDISKIRGAYAARLKEIDHEIDADAFQSLRNARDWALREAKKTGGRDKFSEFNDMSGHNDWPSVEISIDGKFVETIQSNYTEDRFYYEEGNEDFHAPDEVPAPDYERLIVELSQILFPNGSQNDEAMTFEECEKAESLFEHIIVAARDVTLDQYRNMDFRLAEMFVQGWPRSAPLVESGDEAFGWVNEQGQLTERPTLEFLNARIAGMRFEENVSKPEHRWYKAWTLLTSPGQPESSDSLRVSQTDIRHLLKEIRTNFPELESKMNPARVVFAPEQTRDTESSSFPIWWILFIILLLASRLGSCSSERQNDASSAIPSIVEQFMNNRMIVEEVFGRQFESKNELVASNPAVDQWINSIAKQSLDTGGGRQIAIDRAVVQMRQAILKASPEADFDELVVMRELQRDWLKLIDTESGGCDEFRKTLRFPKGISVPEALRDKERQLAWTLSIQGHIQPGRIAKQAKPAPVPVWVIDDVMRQASMSRKSVTRTLHNADSNRSCAFDIALLDSFLSNPEKVSIEVLRTNP